MMHKKTLTFVRVFYHQSILTVAKQGFYFTILLSDLPAVNPGVFVAGILISAPV